MPLNFTLLNYNFSIQDPHLKNFVHTFDQDLYTLIYNHLNANLQHHIPNAYEPFLDSADLLSPQFNFDILAQAAANGIRLKTRYQNLAMRRQAYVRDFCKRNPEMFGIFKNNIISVNGSIRCAEHIVNAACDSTNFHTIKQLIDLINRSSWDRDMTVSEKNSGVSILGKISEKLISRVFDGLLNTTDLFPVSDGKVSSYGDFVLTCLPNNLWVSVKSNFARERMLASGFNNDILGVGFFQEADEFTSAYKIRNYQRAGFLAMYCPDFPLTEEQFINNTSTYGEIIAAYPQADFPRNINGTEFIRPLSRLRDDVETLLTSGNVANRFSADF